jgi:hypothetical protein
MLNELLTGGAVIGLMIGLFSWASWAWHPRHHDRKHRPSRAHR